VEQELITLPGHLNSTPMFSEVTFVLCRSLFVLFCCLTFVFVFLWFSYSDYPFGIFKLFLYPYNIRASLPHICVRWCSLFLTCQCFQQMALCCTCSPHASIVSSVWEYPINSVYRVDTSYPYNVKLSSRCSLLSMLPFQGTRSTRTSGLKALVFVVYSYNGVIAFHADWIDTVVNFNVLYC